LFDKFYQADQSMTRKVEGSGLGLYIVKQIIEAHQGTVKVDSNFGKWTTVSIHLPLS
jgi:signal transduction histidine kinase